MMKCGAAGEQQAGRLAMGRGSTWSTVMRPARRRERLERANLSFASALLATLDARDRYTAEHSADVAMYAEGIAARMGLPVDEQRLAHLCGLVHDVGKISLP